MANLEGDSLLGTSRPASPFGAETNRRLSPLPAVRGLRHAEGSSESRDPPPLGLFAVGLDPMLLVFFLGLEGHPASAVDCPHGMKGAPRGYLTLVFFWVPRQTG